VRDLLTLLSEALAPGDRITVLSDAESYFAPDIPGQQVRLPPGMRDHRRAKKPEEAEEEPPAGLQRILVEGYTRDPSLSTVKSLIVTLTAADFVESADLLSDDERLGAVAAGETPRKLDPQSFVIDIKVAER
jgi:hypothetical protein